MTFALLAGIVATSVAGSVHCLAMCGPLVGLHGGAATTHLALTHSLGRLTTYVAFGAIAGAVGSAVDLAGRVGNIQRAATLFAAGLIAAVGIAQLVQLLARRRRARKDDMQLNCISSNASNGYTSRRDTASTSLHRTPAPSAFASALVRIRPRTAAKRSYLIGTLTGLLPCGWLWAFVIAAAGTASIAGGAAVMLAFWLGTVPAMVGLLRVTGPLLARIRARMPAITAVALIVLGLGTLALRWRDAGATQVDKPHCHCHGATS